MFLRPKRVAKRNKRQRRIGFEGLRKVRNGMNAVSESLLNQGELCRPNTSDTGRRTLRLLPGEETPFIGKSESEYATEYKSPTGGIAVAIPNYHNAIRTLAFVCRKAGLRISMGRVGVDSEGNPKWKPKPIQVIGNTAWFAVYGDTSRLHEVTTLNFVESVTPYDKPVSGNATMDYRKMQDAFKAMKGKAKSIVKPGKIRFGSDGWTKGGYPLRTYSTISPETR